LPATTGAPAAYNTTSSTAADGAAVITCTITAADVVAAPAVSNARAVSA
jgi:hypothetical protein